MFRWFGFFCSRLCTTNSGCSRAKSRQAGFWRLSPLFRYRIEVVGKLVDDWGGTTRVSFQFDGKILADLFLCNRRLIPPHQSLTRQLPPKGKPFIRPCEHGEYNFGKQTKIFKKQTEVQKQTSFRTSARPPCCEEMRRILKRLPLGGKLSRKRLMRGDKSALTKGIHAPYVPPPIGCEAALCKVSHLPICQKLPCTATAAFKTEKNFADRNGGCRAGKFGEMREVRRGKRPLRKGSLPPPRSSSPLHEPLRRDEGVAEKHRDGHRSDAARDGRDEGAERGNRGKVHVTH